jgi:hypothetical protein
MKKEFISRTSVIFQLMGFKYVCFSCHGLMGRVFDEFLVLMGFKFAQFLFPSLRVSLFFLQFSSFLVAQIVFSFPSLLGIFNIAGKIFIL